MEFYGTVGSAKPPLGRLVSQKGLSVIDTEKKCMAWFMDDEIRGSNVDNVDIKRVSPTEQ